jgi:hypothetical protein
LTSNVPVGDAEIFSDPPTGNTHSKTAQRALHSPLQTFTHGAVGITGFVRAPPERQGLGSSPRHATEASTGERQQRSCVDGPLPMPTRALMPTYRRVRKSRWKTRSRPLRHRFRGDLRITAAGRNVHLHTDDRCTEHTLNAHSQLDYCEADLPAARRRSSTGKNRATTAFALRYVPAIRRAELLSTEQTRHARGRWPTEKRSRSFCLNRTIFTHADYRMARAGACSLRKPDASRSSMEIL